MTIHELIDNIADRYIMPKDDDGKLKGLYLQDFGFYSQSKLDKVWYSIKRNHKSNFAPNYSVIVDCMDKAGIGESVEHSASWYQRCNKCGAKYVMGAVSCPRCNKHRPNGDYFKNDVEIIKCQTLPDDVITVRQACSICPVYRGSSSKPRGITCDSFQGDMAGSLPTCDKCNCRLCCLDTGSKNEGMESGTLMGVVDDLVRSKRG